MQMMNKEGYQWIHKRGGSVESGAESTMRRRVRKTRGARYLQQREIGTKS